MQARTAAQGMSPQQIAVTLLILVAVAGLTACGTVFGPSEPDGERFTPPAVYARWWAMTEACSGRSGDLSAVKWYRGDGASSPTHGGQRVAGLYHLRTHSVVLASDALDDGPLVRHEMLHALLRTHRHSRAQFLGACASVLTCSGPCAIEGGPWHPSQPQYALLPPESLSVTSDVELLAPELDGQRWLALRVTVRNPRDRALLVATADGRVTPSTFGYDLRGPTGGLTGGQVATDSSTLFFEPFEAKQWLFEFRVASALTATSVTPGTYLVRGGYAQRWPTFDTVLVSP